MIPLGSIVCSLGPAKTAALPGFHSWSGADVTGSFAGKRELACWKAFVNADEDVTEALIDLGTAHQPFPRTFGAIEKLMCQLYYPKTCISSKKDLRWLMFRKKAS